MLKICIILVKIIVSIIRYLIWYQISNLVSNLIATWFMFAQIHANLLTMGLWCTYFKQHGGWRHKLL